MTMLTTSPSTSIRGSLLAGAENVVGCNHPIVFSAHGTVEEVAG
jgi:hypothetical protein